MLVEFPKRHQISQLPEFIIQVDHLPSHAFANRLATQFYSAFSASGHIVSKPKKVECACLDPVFLVPLKSSPTKLNQSAFCLV